VPAVSFKNDPIVRCKDCRAYINPFAKFIENGAKWICNFCKDVNPVDKYYFSPADIKGLR